MTVKLIAENILTADDFLSATEQEGERIGQPVPAAANAGAFRLLSKGDIADFSYSGTATGVGAVDGTTVIDSVLDMFGDDYFIGGSIALKEVTGANLITNGTMEADSNWANYGTPTLNERSLTQAHGGTYSRKFVADGAGDGIQGDVFTTVTGSVYRINLWVYPANTTSVFVAIRNGDDSGWNAASGEKTGLTQNAWNLIPLDITETAGGAGAYIVVYSGEIGTFYVDDVLLYLVNTANTSKSITDFAQATGTITTTAWTLVVPSGTVFTLTVSFATRDFAVELIAGGDAGDATFKWSHDGGTTYLGRDNPNQASWLGEKVEVLCSTTYFKSKLIECNNGSWVLIYNQRGGDVCYCVRSTDQGITWGSEISIFGSNDFEGVFKLKSGRIIVMFPNATGNIKYSDDHGVTWSSFTFAWSTGIPISAVELFNGNVIGVFSYTSIIYCQISSDGGLTWGAPIVIANDTRDQNYPSVVQAVNGDIVVAYQTDEDVLNNIEIKCKISSDGGTTWGSAIAVMNYVADITYPTLCKDINGDIYCAAAQGGDIDYTISTDNGATWTAGAIATLHDSGDTLGNPSLAVMGGNQIVCTYGNTTDNTIESVRRGVWEAFSANACPCAIDAIEQKLICDVGIVWHGGAGIAGDDWTFDAEYDYAMSNLIEDSPARPWRSEQDNIACTIVIDMGANERHYVNGVGFFGCNIRTLSFQMNATDSWGAPSVDESVSFDFVTGGVVDSVTGNHVEDAALLASYKDHELVDKFIRMTSGTDDGVTWKIKDNVGTYLVLDTTAATNVAVSDTFIIFQDHISKAFTGGSCRFMRVSIAAQQTSDNYYQIGMMVAGRTVALSSDWGVGWTKTNKYDIEFLRTKHGGIVPIKNAERKRVFVLDWLAAENSRTEVVSLVDHIDGKNICVIPNHSTLTDCYLMKSVDDISMSQRYLERFDFTVNLEEIL